MFLDGIYFHYFHNSCQVVLLVRPFSSMPCIYAVLFAEVTLVKLMNLMVTNISFFILVNFKVICL